MNETQKMIRDMNNLIRSLGDEAINIPEPDDTLSDLDFLRIVKREYTSRLLRKVPKYQALKSEALIPDMFLDALRRHEAELEARSVK